MAVSDWSWVSEVAIATQGFIHLWSQKVTLQCVSFAALVPQPLIVSTIQFTCPCKTYTVLALLMVFIYLSGPHVC